MPDSISSISAGPVELSIHALASDGRGIARLEGLTVFVEGAFPGQKIEARITAMRSRYAEAVAERVLTPAPCTRPAPCPHADVCGGCPWQSLPYAQQLRWKEQIVRDALCRVGHISDPPVRRIMPSPSEWHYRNKMSFAFGVDEKGMLTLGQRARRTHAVAAITGCLMQDEKAMRLLELISSTARAGALSAATPQHPGGFWRHVVLRHTRSGLRHVEIITGRNRRTRAVLQNLAAEIMREPGVDGVAVTERTSPGAVARGDRTTLVTGCTELFETLTRPAAFFPPHTPASLRISFDHSSFFQVNTAAAEMLYGQAAELVSASPVDTLWDLYCGAGSIGLFLAPLAQKVYGVEIIEEAIIKARQNAKAAGLEHCTFTARDAGTAFALMASHGMNARDVVCVDPPRAGLDRKLTDKLLELRPGRIVYISCNPATLARDIARLAAGYELVEARPVDLFPQTPHVETVCLLRLSAGSTSRHSAAHGV